jgi:uncharacterized membrane protein YfcA
MTLALALSLLVGLSLGLLGGGGSILTLPILIYALHQEEKAAIATSLIVVGLTSAAAVVSHARQGNVEWRQGLLFAAGGACGAFLGGLLADFIPGQWLVRGFLLMMLATGLAMIRGRREVEGRREDLAMPFGRIVLDGLVVGLATGLVGAGGGFLVVPALALLGGLTMQKAIGTSLLVIAIKSFAGYAGHALHVAVDLQLALMVSAAAIVGSFGGGLLAPRLPAAMLRKGFGIFVLLMALWMGYQQL